MARQAAAVDAQTYVPDQAQEGLMQQLAAVLDGFEAGAGNLARLVGPGGESVAIPDSMFPVLRHVVEALAQGKGVTVAPMDATLTTQEAADFLGISRPTLVRVLERGELPFEKPGRHRYVRLVDLMAFQRHEREARRQALDRMARDAEAMELYEATDSIPPRMR